MKDLLLRARRVLESNFTPPARYGTAFHLNPPVADVRQLGTESGRMDLAAWEQLTDEDQQRILSLDVNDVYLAWQLTQIPRLLGDIIQVAPGASQQIALTGAGLYFIFLGANSQLAIIDHIQHASLAIRRLFVWQQAGSNLFFTGLRSNVGFLNEKLQVELLGRQAKAQLTHLTYGQGSEQYDLAVEAYHRSPGATSQLHVRSAASQKSKTIYRGLIDVDRAAAGTNGYQSGRALLLARGAVVDQLPKLEIRTNDVRCSHGVTTTHLDDQSLFYLRSRGLPAAQARQLAITGFFHHQLDIPAQIGKSLQHVMAIS